MNTTRSRLGRFIFFHAWAAERTETLGPATTRPSPAKKQARFPYLSTNLTDANGMMQRSNKESLRHVGLLC